MNKEDIVAMAIKSHLLMYDYNHPSLKAFAALVASAEREACAKLCENKNTLLEWPTYAAAIRARRQA